MANNRPDPQMPPIDNGPRLPIDETVPADELRAALEECRKALVIEHGHDVGEAPWPSCLPIHMVLNRATRALARRTVR